VEDQVEKLKLLMDKAEKGAGGTVVIDATARDKKNAKPQRIGAALPPSGEGHCRFKLGQKARNYRTTETAKKGKTPGHGFGHRGFLVQRQSRVWRIVIAPKSSTVPNISATV
jgi:hypothetical protein